MDMKQDNSKTRVYKHREKKRTVKIEKGIRQSIRGTLWKWGHKYFSPKFTKEPSRYHKSFVDKLESVIRDGGNFAFAFPRGSAKTTWLRIACIWSMCEAITPYIIFIGGSATEAKANLKIIKNDFESNDKLNEDYPELCGPIRAIRGVAQRARMMQDENGNVLAFEWKSDFIRMPNVPGLKSAGYMIQALGIESHIRGKNESLPKGESTRPTLVLLDDPQTREDAKSQTTVTKLIDTINGDVLGLAGPGKKIAALVAGTIIERGDVMDQLTNKKLNPSWHGVRISMLESRAKHEKDVWFGEYARLRRESQQNDEDTATAANAFYTAHRAEMDEGAIAYWDDRYIPEEGETSAIQHAYNLLIDKEEKVFAAEYQNAPLAAQTNVFELRPERIYAKMNGASSLSLPPLPVTVTAGVDLNRYGLTWNLVSSTRDLASAVIAYGVHVPHGQERIYKGEGNKNTEAEQLAFFRALADLCGKFASLRIFDHAGRPQRIRRVGIDAGYLYTTVRRFTAMNANEYPFDIIATRGRAAMQYRARGPNVEQTGKDWIIITDQFGRLTVYNSDIWTETSQTGFLLPSGAPGSVDLYGVSKAEHAEYATQICNQKLAEKLEGDKGLYYRWTTEGRNDYLDSLTIARVMASLGGADILNQTLPQQQSPAPSKEEPKQGPPPENLISYDPLLF